MDGGNEQSCHNILFQSRSVCDKNTSIGAEGFWEWGSEPLKRFWVIFSISRRKGAGRRWREWWPSKIDSNWGKHCSCCWFCQKWPSNRIKNDSRIFEHPKDSSFSDSERGFGKEKVVCTFCSTLLDIWAKGRSSRILPRHYRDGRCGQTFFKQNFYGRWDLVFCPWPRDKVTEFWMGCWDNPSGEETEIPKAPLQDPTLRA
jgi:hypothetical protein